MSNDAQLLKRAHDLMSDRADHDAIFYCRCLLAVCYRKHEKRVMLQRMRERKKGRP